MFKKLYPTPYAKSGDVTDDGRYYYCKQCGQVCDKQTTKTAKKYSSFDSIINSTDNTEVSMGCPFCGTGLSK